MSIIKMETESVQTWLTLFKGKESWRASFDGVLPRDLGEWQYGFCKYMGCGHHLYVFAENYDEAKLKDIMSRKENPSKMIGPLKAISQRAMIVMLDAEMGGMSLWL